MSDSTFGAAFDHANDIRSSCRDSAFISTNEKSDYSLRMTWEKDHWWSILSGDDQVLLTEESPDFNKIVRDACRAIRENEDWPVRPARVAKDALLDRYELRDLRNGNVATSGLLDKQTGKVWIWSTTPKGRTAFLSEDVVPSPDTE